MGTFDLPHQSRWRNGWAHVWADWAEESTREGYEMDALQVRILTSRRARESKRLRRVRHLRNAWKDRLDCGKDKRI